VVAEGVLVAWLADLDQSATSFAGGKGANLGELFQAGFPVPPAFVVTTAGYQRFITDNDLQSQILELATRPDKNDPATYATISNLIHDRFMAGSLATDLAEPILQAYAALNQHASASAGVPVAVRSSATAEDLPTASFAGQQETFLNVAGEEALLAAIKECWAGLWTARAMAYRERMHIDPALVAMAVVVQVLIPAEVSGILFTANPTTGARDEIVVNAGFGLGEVIVSGRVTPDTFLLDRETLTVRETKIGAKERMIVPAGDQQTVVQSVPATRREQPALSPETLHELAELGVRVEAHFDGLPQDIEWAVAGGHCWLLQARPITNLPPPPLRDVCWEPPRPGTIWMRRQIVEHMPEPLSPLFDELYLQEGLDQSIQAMVYSISDLIGLEINVWDFVQPPFATTVNGYAYSIASFNYDGNMILIALRVYTTALPKMLRHMVPYWREQALPAYRATIACWKELDVAAAVDRELLRGMRELALADAVYWFAAAVPLGLARVTDAALDRYLKFVFSGRRGKHGPTPTSGHFLRGFPSRTLAAQVKLEDIGRTIHRNDALRMIVAETPAAELLAALAAHPDGQNILDALQQYLAEYGHQIYNLDFAAPTLADDPLPVLLALKAAVAHPQQDARAHQELMAGEREALVARTEKALNPPQRWLFRLLLGWAQRYSPNREEALFFVGAAWPALRRLALELGRRLMAAGSLNSPDDIFYLRSADLQAAITAREEGADRPDLAELALEQRALREARRQLDPPVVVPPGGRLKFGPIDMGMLEPKARATSTGPTLNGFAVSPGQVVAPASVIRSPDDFDQMLPDTILVCTTTTPAWTPLFAQAKGLVTDIGGALAHGSIVAREYGIPAVMGTGVATQRITSGQRIRVDGNTGTVTLVDEVAHEGVDQPPAGKPKSRRLSLKWLLALGGVAIGLAIWWKRRGDKPA